MDICKLTEYLNTWKNDEMEKFLTEYRIPGEPVGFVRKIGDKGIYYNYEILKKKSDKELEILSKELTESLQRQSFFKSLFITASERESEKKRFQMLSDNYRKEKKLREDEILIAKAVLKKDLSEIEKYSLSNLPFFKAIDEQKKLDKNYFYEKVTCNKAYIKADNYLKFSNMSGMNFEKYVCDLLKRLGYKNVTLTSRLGTGASYTGDGGIDITAIDDQNRKVAIQCKKKNLVSNDIISRTHGAKDLSQYKCDYAMVVTSGEFTVPAIIEARDLNVELWDGKKLEALEQFYNAREIEDKGN